jgi:hypothetical protein
MEEVGTCRQGGRQHLCTEGGEGKRKEQMCVKERRKGVKKGVE